MIVFCLMSTYFRTLVKEGFGSNTQAAGFHLTTVIWGSNPILGIELSIDHCTDLILPCRKRLHSYGKSPFGIGESAVN